MSPSFGLANSCCARVHRLEFFRTPLNLACLRIPLRQDERLGLLYDSKPSHVPSFEQPKLGPEAPSISLASHVGPRSPIPMQTRCMADALMELSMHSLAFTDEAGSTSSVAFRVYGCHKLANFKPPPVYTSLFPLNILIHYTSHLKLQHQLCRHIFPSPEPLPIHTTQHLAFPSQPTFTLQAHPPTLATPSLVQNLPSSTRLILLTTPSTRNHTMSNTSRTIWAVIPAPAPPAEATPAASPWQVTLTVLTEQALAIARDSSGPPPKPGFSSIRRSSYSSSSSAPGRDEVVEIPEILNSQETLVFFGLRPDLAGELYEDWLEFQQTPGELGYGEDIMSFAFDYLKYQARGMEFTRFSTVDDWRQVLAELGVSRRLADAIFDANCAEIRKSRSPPDWVLDTFQIAWDFLRVLNARILRREMEQDGLVPPLPSTAPAARDGRVTLRKGGAMSRLASVFMEDGSLYISDVLSGAPTQFHHQRHNLLCLTDLAYAEKCASFCHLRVPAEDGGVLAFAIPDELFAGLKEAENRDWQQLVWWAQRCPYVVGEHPPMSLAPYLEAPLLIGYMCQVPPHVIQQLPSSGQLYGQHLRIRGGHDAIQFLFQSWEVQQQIQAQCAGWTWLRPQNELEEFFIP